MSVPAASAPVVVGLDHSPAAHAALQHAHELALRTGSDLQVVHVFELPALPGAALEADLGGERTAARHRAMRWVADALGDHSGVHVSIATPEGDVEGALLSAARGASTIVVGAAQQRRREGLAQRLADDGACEVIEVDERGRARLVARPVG
jgi:nucleotide-binding universal stress UspA family protein